jgi:hypothetical protein
VRHSRRTGLQRARKPGAAVTETARHGASDTTAGHGHPNHPSDWSPPWESYTTAPLETEREARAAAHQIVRPEPGWSILHKSQNRFVLEQACEVAGVELDAYDRRILDWLSGFEDSICGVVAGLVARAVAAARPGPRCVMFDLTNDHHAEIYVVLTEALEEFASRERDQAPYEEGDSFRNRWADIADAMRAQVDITLDGDR